MGPLSLLLRLPLLPLQGVIKLGEIIGDEADRQLRDPARIRRVLEEAQQQWAAGEITDEELASIQEQATGLLISYDMPARKPAGDDRS